MIIFVICIIVGLGLTTGLPGKCGYAKYVVEKSGDHILERLTRLNGEPN